MIKFIILSGRRDFCDFISSRADSLKLMDSLEKLGGGEFIAFHIAGSNSTEKAIVEYIYSKIDYDKDDAIVILCDEYTFPNIVSVNNSLLICRIEGVHSIKYKQFHNFISSATNKAIKKINLIKSIVDDGGLGEMARLPIKNFEFEGFKEFIREASTRFNSTVSDNEFQKLASDLKLTRQPKKRSDYKVKYYIDDKQRHFSLDDEIHSSYDTAGHDLLCDISAKYRFGCRIDYRKHFNVSAGEKDDSKLSTKFYHCHGASLITVKDRTHVNMFSNDFIS